MKKQYEAWSDPVDNSVCLSLTERIQEMREQGLPSQGAKLLYRIEADTAEEANAVHNIKMGWGPYRPIGEAVSCPNNCGAMFYPEGSGECPNCGRIC